MNVRFLETFIWVAKLRSFSAAAQRLHSTQAAISNRIATLERDLGTKLFDRDLRDVRLTHAGRLLLERAIDIVRLTSEFRESIVGPRPLSRTISIGVVDMIVYAWLSIFLERMRLEYPGLKIVLTIDTSQEVARQLSLGEVDIGLVLGPVYDAKLINLDLGAYPCCWIASTNSDLPEAPIELRRLTETPLLTYGKTSLPYHDLLQLLDRRGIDRGGVRIYNSNSIATVMKLVSDDVGTACIPELLAREAIARGEVRKLDVDALAPPIRLHGVYSSQKGNQVSALVAEMAAAVAADFSSVDFGTGKRAEEVRSHAARVRGAEVHAG